MFVRFSQTGPTVTVSCSKTITKIIHYYYSRGELKTATYPLTNVSADNYSYVSVIDDGISFIDRFEIYNQDTLVYSFAGTDEQENYVPDTLDEKEKIKPSDFFPQNKKVELFRVWPRNHGHGGSYPFFYKFYPSVYDYSDAYQVTVETDTKNKYLNYESPTEITEERLADVMSDANSLFFSNNNGRSYIYNDTVITLMSDGNNCWYNTNNLADYNVRVENYYVGNLNFSDKPHLVVQGEKTITTGFNSNVYNYLNESEYNSIDKTENLSHYSTARQIEEQSFRYTGKEPKLGVEKYRPKFNNGMFYTVR